MFYYGLLRAADGKGGTGGMPREDTARAIIQTKSMTTAVKCTCPGNLSCGSEIGALREAACQARLRISCSICVSHACRFSFVRDLTLLNEIHFLLRTPIFQKVPVSKARFIAFPNRNL